MKNPPTIIVVGDFYLGKLYLTFSNLYVNLYLELKINVKSLKTKNIENTNFNCICSPFWIELCANQ